MKKSFILISVVFLLFGFNAGAQGFSVIEPLTLGKIVMEVSWKETGGEIFYRLGYCEVTHPLRFCPGQSVSEVFTGEVVTIADAADIENKVLCPFAIVMGDSVFYLTVNEEGFYRYCDGQYLRELPYSNQN